MKPVPPVNHTAPGARRIAHAVERARLDDREEEAELLATVADAVLVERRRLAELRVVARRLDLREEVGREDAVVLDRVVVAAVLDLALPAARGIVEIAQGRGVLRALVARGRVAEPVNSTRWFDSHQVSLAAQL
jgi:hypothetical protein